MEMNTKNYWRMAAGLLVVQLLLYFTVYDASYYHIDKVREPMIEFLFFQSMILGLHYRWRSQQCNDEYKPLSKLEIGGGHFAPGCIFCIQDTICKDAFNFGVPDCKSNGFMGAALCAL